MKKSQFGLYWFSDDRGPWFFTIDLSDWGVGIETKKNFIAVQILCFEFGWDK